MSGREIRIGLLWHSAAAGNLGVGALTLGNLISARSVATGLGLTPRFTIIQPVTDVPDQKRLADDVEVFDITGRSMVTPSMYLALLRRLDCILDIGAGDSFADIYGPKRFAYLMYTKEAAYACGVPLLFSPQTIGPFTREPYRALAGHAMRKAFAVIARDPESYAAVRRISPKARAIQSIDVAFRLPYEVPTRPTSGTVEVGINVSGLLFNGGYSGGNEFGLQIDYAQLMRSFIRKIGERPGVRVHLICHVNSNKMPVDDDGRVADTLAAEFPGVIRAPTFQNPSDAKSYIAGLDFLVAGRMHACIAAYSAGVPVVPIAYSRKFSGLFGGVLGYPHQVPVSGLSTDEALDFLLAKFDARAELAEDVVAGQTVVQAGLEAYDAELRRLFRSVSAGRRQGIGA